MYPSIVHCSSLVSTFTIPHLDRSGSSHSVDLPTSGLALHWFFLLIATRLIILKIQSHSSTKNPSVAPHYILDLKSKLLSLVSRPPDLLSFLSNSVSPLFSSPERQAATPMSNEAAFCRLTVPLASVQLHCFLCLELTAWPQPWHASALHSTFSEVILSLCPTPYSKRCNNSHWDPLTLCPELSYSNEHVTWRPSVLMLASFMTAL